MFAADRIPLMFALNPWVGVAVIIVGMMWAMAAKKTAAPRLAVLVIVVLAMLFITVPKGGV